MAFYDHCDYRRYWRGRQYEDQAEAQALKKLFRLIPNKKEKTLVDIGAGFGRHTPRYGSLFKRSTLIEPSAKLLQLAKRRQKNPRLVFKKGRAEALPLTNQSQDVALLIRIIHHLPKLDPVFEEINRVLKPGGFLILEFANKIHFKARAEAVLRGHFLFTQEEKPLDRRSPANKNKASIAFLNYHPKTIEKILKKHHFQILKKLSVSNFRSPFLKKIIPLNLLLEMEKITQSFLASFNFGPSLFILAQKKKH